jgi:hypothetical protein
MAASSFEDDQGHLENEGHDHDDSAASDPEVFIVYPYFCRIKSIKIYIRDFLHTKDTQM